ncbi:MAG: PUR family DNA/RNA-binding protein [Chitinophagaceae bacterium]|nr:PUR family DNA/RNA-binding protein [Chitinophagaceae bacterium]
MAYENNDKRMESIYSKRIRAGKRRTYFFDVRSTRGNDYYLTITESRKRFTGEGYDRHKIFLYKEDFNKFIKGLSEAVDYVKTELMPDFDFDAFNHDDAPSSGDGEYTPAESSSNGNSTTAAPAPAPVAEAEPTAAPAAEVENHDNGLANEEVDKW